MPQWKRDVLYGIGLIVGCGVLFWQTIGMPLGNIQYFWARADVYVWIWLTLISVLGLVMIISALIKKDTTPTKPIWSKEGVFTIISMAIYLVIMKKLGFILSTFLVTEFLTFIYSKRLKGFEGKTKKECIIKIGWYTVFSILATIAVYLAFAKGLKVSLPTFSLF